MLRATCSIHTFSSLPRTCVSSGYHALIFGVGGAWVPLCRYYILHGHVYVSRGSGNTCMYNSSERCPYGIEGLKHCKTLQPVGMHTCSSLLQLDYTSSFHGAVPRIQAI